MNIVKSVASRIEEIKDYKKRATGNRKIVITLTLEKIDGHRPKLMCTPPKLIAPNGSAYESYDIIPRVSSMWTDSPYFDFSLQTEEYYLEEGTIFNFTYRFKNRSNLYVTETFVYRNKKWFRKSPDKCTDDNEGE